MIDVLIVEDEVLIADRIAHYLLESDVLPELNILGPAATFEEAVVLCEERSPSVVLIDIRLQGPKDGIDVAKYIRQCHANASLIFLTSQFGSTYLEQARALNPNGYLLKPIDRRNLCATVLLSLKPALPTNQPSKKISLYAGSKVVHVELDELLYVEADHVYVNYHFARDIVIVVRQSLAQTEEILIGPEFIRIHRSFIINRKHISGNSTTTVTIQGCEIPISRSRRADILNLLAEV